MKRGVGNINKCEVIMLILCSYYGMSYEEFKKRLIKEKDYVNKNRIPTNH